MKPSVVAEEIPFLLAQKRPVFIWGKSGIGKSSVMRQTAERNKLLLNDVRAGQLDSIDVRGFPVPDMKKRQMEWLPADFLPRESDKPGILFLDEMNGATPVVGNALYQLILDRRIGNYKLPDHWGLVAAGNYQGDRGVTYEMPAPLSNRFVHIDFVLDAHDWQVQAAADGIDPRIRAYLTLKPDSLHVYDSAINPRSFPSPRSWYFADQILKGNRKKDREVELLKGTVGEGAAIEFFGFCAQLADMPDIDFIMLNPKTAPLPKSQPVMHAVSKALGDRTKASNFARVMEYVTRMQREFQIVFVTEVGTRDKAIMNTKAYTDWILVNHDVIN